MVTINDRNRKKKKKKKPRSISMFVCIWAVVMFNVSFTPKQFTATGCFIINWTWFIIPPIVSFIYSLSLFGVAIYPELSIKNEFVSSLLGQQTVSEWERKRNTKKQMNEERFVQYLTIQFNIVIIVFKFTFFNCQYWICFSKLIQLVIEVNLCSNMFKVCEI